jgi:hypothetical protein
MAGFVISEVMKWKGEYFFWTGGDTIRTAAGNWQRALERLGKAAGVKFHAHQLRDSLAVSFLTKGVIWKMSLPFWQIRRRFASSITARGSSRDSKRLVRR